MPLRGVLGTGVDVGFGPWVVFVAVDGDPPPTPPGMLSTWPGTRTLGLRFGFASKRAWLVTPNWREILESQSPG